MVLEAVDMTANITLNMTVNSVDTTIIGIWVSVKTDTQMEIYLCLQSASVRVIRASGLLESFNKSLQDRCDLCAGGRALRRKPICCAAFDYAFSHSPLQGVQRPV